MTALFDQGATFRCKNTGRNGSSVLCVYFINVIEQMLQEVTLMVVLQKPTPGVEYGIQKGKGSKYETVQKQLSETADLSFEIAVPLKFKESNHVMFTGPFIQGQGNERFIYIDIGTYAGQKNTPWSRRLKIPVKDITKSMIESLSPAKLLVAKVPGTGKDGGPTCGTIKPFDGWRVIDRGT